MFVLADVCADLIDAERAATLYRLLLPYSSHNAMLGNVYTYGSVAFALGRLSVVLRPASTMLRRISNSPWPPIEKSEPRSGWLIHSASSQACFWIAAEWPIVRERRG